MLAEVCRFYGWTLTYCLSMPATQFFLMLSCARNLRNQEMSELCDIQAISICSSEYHKIIKDRYAPIEIEAEYDPQAPKSLPRGTIQPQNPDEARDIVIQLFTMKKQVMGHE